MTYPFNEIRQRSVQGLVALAVRGGAGKLVAIGSFVILSHLLTSDDFGAFAIILLPIGLLTLAADAGISQALVQRAGELSPGDEQVGFTLGLLLATGLGLLTVAGAGIIGQLYRLSPDARWGLRALALGPLINAFGLVPGVRLNRALRFDRLAWAEFGSLIAGQSAALIGAAAGQGIWSLVYGALMTTVTGTVLVNIFAPWQPGLALSQGARRLLAFGLPYQSQGLLHLAIEKIVPALGGLWLATAQVGYLSWAQDVARWPRIPADYVARVGFAAFSCLQQDAAELNSLLNDALLLVCSICFPLAALGVVAAPWLIGPVFGPEWRPATVPLQVFLIQVPFDALATLLLPVIYATGAAGRGLGLSTVWALITWGTGWLFLHLWPGLIALPAAFLVTTAVMLVLIVFSMPRGIHIRWGRSAGLPLLVALVLGGAARLVLGTLP